MGKEEVKQSLFVSGMLLYLKYPKLHQKEKNEPS
jgi:hypothetical protein